MPFIASNGLTEAGTSKTIAVGGMPASINVHYHDVGEGEPVLFLHSYGLALEAQPPTGRLSRPTSGVQVPSRCSQHGDSRATPGRPARSGQPTMPTSQSPL